MLPGGSQGLRILSLGDSYTIGEGVASDERWPEQMVARLREQGLNTRAPLIVARTGWTTDELAAALAERIPAGPFDLVTLLIGVNNQYRGRDLQEYQAQFRHLTAQAIFYAGGRAGRVMILSIPDWGATPFARGRDRVRISAEIDAFNAVNRVIAREAGAIYVDITPVSRLAAGDNLWLAPDELHPSGKMYAAWVELALPQALLAFMR